MFFGKRTQSTKKTRRNRCLEIERLENRTLLSASSGLSAFFAPYGPSEYYSSLAHHSGSGTSNVGNPAPAITAVDYSLGLPAKVQSGTIVAVTVTALGSNGRVATGYTGTGTSGAGVANLTSSDGALFYATATSTSAMTTPTVDFTNGVATVYVKFVNAGSQTITAADSSTSSITGSAGTFVEASDPVALYGANLPRRYTQARRLPFKQWPMTPTVSSIANTAERPI